MTRDDVARVAMALAWLVVACAFGARRWTVTGGDDGTHGWMTRAGGAPMDGWWARSGGARARLVTPEALRTRVDVGDDVRGRSGAWRAVARALARVRGGRIWLGVLGEAFDVTRGARYYAGDGEYARCFSGRDATRAFVTGDFTEEGCVSDVRGLTGAQLSGARGWRDFMRGK